MMEITVGKLIISSILYVDSSSTSVLTVIHDSTGMNQDCQYHLNIWMGTADRCIPIDDIDDEHKTPRGIRGYKLLGNNGIDFDTWKVAGSEFSVYLSDKLSMGTSV